MEVHEVCGLFPMMGPDRLKELAADVAAHGLREPIWTHRGRVIDGRNRLRACEMAGVKPEFREWDGRGSLVEFVLSLNLHRRHLSETQRGTVAAKLATMSRGRRSLNAEISAFSQSEAAEKMGVSRGTVQNAKQAIERGIPELVEAMERDEVSAGAAAEVATLPKGEQAELVARGPAAVREKAADIRGAAARPPGDADGPLLPWNGPPDGSATPPPRRPRDAPEVAMVAVPLHPRRAAKALRRHFRGDDWDVLVEAIGDEDAACRQTLGRSGNGQ
jgi:ParB-like chromosome segregation protein Spo0J